MKTEFYLIYLIGFLITYGIIVWKNIKPPNGKLGIWMCFVWPVVWIAATAVSLFFFLVLFEPKFKRKNPKNRKDES